MVAHSQLRVPASETQPAELSPHRTQPFNATSRPGLPDKPAPQRAPVQKCADEEQAKQAKEAKKTALKAAYQRIASLQAGMANEQSKAKKNRVAVRPKLRVVKKDHQPVLPIMTAMVHTGALAGPTGVRDYSQVT